MIPLLIAVVSKNVPRMIHEACSLPSPQRQEIILNPLCMRSSDCLKKESKFSDERNVPRLLLQRKTKCILVKNALANRV